MQERFAELSPSFLTISGESITVTCYKTMGRSFPTPATVSKIPTEDLEKSPAPIIPDVSRQSNEGFWTEDIDADDESPPLCYEQALKMARLS